MGSIALNRQPVKEKENSVFKPVKLCLKNWPGTGRVWINTELGLPSPPRWSLFIILIALLIELYQKGASLVCHKTASDSKALILGSVEYSFITITPRSTLTKSGTTCKNPSMGQKVMVKKNHMKQKKNKESQLCNSLVWSYLVLWHINLCRLFNAKSIFIHMKFYLNRFSLT